MTDLPGAHCVVAADMDVKSHTEFAHWPVEDIAPQKVQNKKHNKAKM
jgi:phosphatidylethanolamine-binding protein (PEBP) family uncharacterized protein